MTEQHRDVRDYLKRLERALSHVPRQRRKEIVGEIEAHITQELAALGHDPAEHEIVDVLEAVGEPETIAAEENTEVPQRRTGRGLEIAALSLLLVGAFILPVIGWVIGVVLLWNSSVWTTRDKLIGTLILPGGLAFPFYLLVFGGAASQSCTGGTVFKVFSDGRRKEVTRPLICESGGVSRPLMTALLVVLVVAAIGSIIYLARRMKKPPIAE